MGFDDLPTFPVRFTGPMFKGTKAEARAKTDEKKQDVKAKEDRNKSIARKRDGWACRFPRCVCIKRRLSAEACHVDGDKGMAGDHGNRSHHSQLLCLCRLRHRESAISLHYQTLRIRFLTARKANGPVAWDVNLTAVTEGYLSPKPAQWVEVARERDVRELEPPSKEQGALLERIAEMAS